MKFIEEFAHRDCHFAHSKTSVVQHIRMCNGDGVLHTMCGHTADDWIREDVVEDVYCQPCMMEMADFLVEEIHKAPMKLELVDWDRERRLMTMAAYANRN